MSDDEEETKRIVRSAREKRYEALNNLIHSIRNSKKIKDFNKMETHFVDLCKAYEKAKPVIEKEEKGVTPRFYVRILVELDDLINETWEDKEGRKRMSKNNSKSLGKSTNLVMNSSQILQKPEKWKLNTLNFPGKSQK